MRSTTRIAGAFAGNSDWAQIQGVSRAEVREGWYLCYDAAGAPLPEAGAAACRTLVYKPLGGVQPAGNFIISDSDFVEVLTEIDIQTPIPTEVQTLRTGKSFLFLGCRFNDQLPNFLSPASRRQASRVSVSQPLTRSQAASSADWS